MHLYEVDKLYSPNRTSWPEQFEFNYRSGVCEIRAFFPGLRQPEIDAYKTGKARFALYLEGVMIFLLARFGNLEWSDGAFCYHLIPQDEQTLPPVVAPNEGALMTTFLVSGDTGILRVIRVCSLSHEFTQVLYQAIRDQAAQPFNPTDYDRKLARIYADMTTRQMVDKAIVRCTGGDDQSPAAYTI